MRVPDTSQNGRLLAYNQHVLDQAMALVQMHAAPDAPAFSGPVGAHLRHVIEHVEALVHGVRLGVVDYDGRPRDRQLETCPALARERLATLRQKLGQWTPEMLVQPLQVLGQGGQLGDFQFSVLSSVGRELAFVASHAVHHFALLAAHLQRLGVDLPAHFGVAPATVANNIASRAASSAVLSDRIACATSITDPQESPCLSPMLPA